MYKFWNNYQLKTKCTWHVKTDFYFYTKTLSCKFCHPWYMCERKNYHVLKVYNPALQGYAIYDGFTVHNTSKLNLGEPGALSIDMLYSAQVLLRRMQDDPNIDVQKHWKVRNWQIDKLINCIANTVTVYRFCLHGTIYFCWFLIRFVHVSLAVRN